MQHLLRLEELVMFLISIFFFSLLDYQWWIFPVLLLTPDIGMIGYTINTRVGAIAYNLFHHKGIAILIGFSGYWWSVPELQLAGVILFGHSSMDRMMGYGLKYPDSFKHTHLGEL